MAEEFEGEVCDGAAVFPLIPAELGVQPLLLAVLHATVFLAGSDEDVVNSEAAIETIDYLAGYLQRLRGADLRRVKEDLQVLIAYAKDQDWPKQQVRFFKEFLSSYGIGTEGEA